MDEDKKIISIQLSKEMDKKLRIKAAEEEISKSELVRRLLEKALKEEKDK